MTLFAFTVGHRLRNRYTTAFSCRSEAFAPRPGSNVRYLARSLNIVIALGCLVGCGASQPPPPFSASLPTVGSAAPPAHSAIDSLKVSSLDQLMQERRANASDFPIGIGDVIQVSLPGLKGTGAGFENSGGGSAAAGGSDPAGEEAFDSETVRVDGMGDIDLHFVGKVHAAGLTEGQLKEELERRLNKYMYSPEVELFVKSYSSREVAVSGEVHQPGMYTVNGPTETVHDLIIQAGGTTDNAASRIVLTPAKENPNAAIASTASHLAQTQFQGAAVHNPNGAPPLNGMLKEPVAASYVIDLGSDASADRYLNMPVRPGDTIYVPRAGSVSVVGWVYAPKSLDITPGLTVLGAISAAGGPMYAADQTNIKIIRQNGKDETSTIVVNLKDIKSAHERDVPLQANDVVEVGYSTWKIPGYALYYGIQGIFNFAPAAMMVNGL
jgi:polysaccharide export outer membrane protein